jgi:CO dehydrogenase maturation factor
MCEDCAAHGRLHEHGDAMEGKRRHDVAFHDDCEYLHHGPGGEAAIPRPAQGGPKVLAVCGKGGVGKTSVAAMAVHELMHHDPAAHILVIDADPAVGLSTALAVNVVRTVDDVRNDIIDSSKTGDAGDVTAILDRLDYEVFQAMAEQDGYAFLAIGRPETEGCYCKVNDYLKDIIEGLVEHFDYVVIDGEAGIEQVNRRVLETVTHLLLVSDCSRKGLAVVQTIKQVADGGVLPYDHVGLLLSRVHASEDARHIDAGGVEILGCIMEDDAVRTFDIEGESLLKLPHGDAAMVEVGCALHRFGVLG